MDFPFFILIILPKADKNAPIIIIYFLPRFIILSIAAYKYILVSSFYVYSYPVFCRQINMNDTKRIIIKNGFHIRQLDA